MNGPTADEYRWSDAARRVNRSIRDGDRYKVRQKQSKTDGNAGESNGRVDIGCSDHGNDKNERKDELGKGGGSKIVVPGRMRPESVGGESLDGWIVSARHTSRDDKQNSGSHYAPGDLCDPVARSMLARHFVTDEKTQGHGRINVAAGDVPDRINHRHQRQAEGDGNAESACLAARKNGGPASCEDEDESTDKFGNIA
jgi:hypothetical protein